MIKMREIYYLFMFLGMEEIILKDNEIMHHKI